MPQIENIKLKEIMTLKVISLNDTDPFSLVYEKMNTYKIRHLPVVNKKSEIVGIITERDLYRAAHPRETEEGWVYDKAELDLMILSHFMSKDPSTLTPEDTIKDALRIMTENKYGCIPIVWPGKKLAGIVSYTDILKYTLKVLTIS